MDAADKKQKDVAFVANFVEKDIAYTIKDAEECKERNDKRVIGASKEMKKQKDLMDKNVDNLMAMVISAFKPHLEQVNEEDEP